MRWTVNIDEWMPWNRKISRLSDAAFRLHHHAICWASREGTDGAITPDDLPDVAPKMRRREKVVAELVEAELWEPTPPLGWVVHDYLDWQPSAEARRQMSESKSGAGSVGNHRRWHERRGVRDPDCTYCIANGSQ